jgi:hypothetical protein
MTAEMIAQILFHERPAQSNARHRRKQSLQGAG